MIFLVPMVPIIIAVAILVLAITVQVASAIELITQVGMILVIITSVLSVILNICRKDATVGERIACTIISIIASIISFSVSRTFFSAIIDVDTNNLMGTIEFLWVLIMGGGMWLASVGMATYASYNAIYDFEYEEYSISIYLLIGAGILGSLLIKAAT